MSNVKLKLSSNVSWLLYRLVLWNWKSTLQMLTRVRTANIKQADIAGFICMENIFPNRICLNILSSLFPQFLFLMVTCRQWCSRATRWLPWQTHSQEWESFLWRTCDIIAFIIFFVRNNERCANANRKIHNFQKTLHIFRLTQIQSYSHKYVRHVGTGNTLIYCLYI